MNNAVFLFTEYIRLDFNAKPQRLGDSVEFCATSESLLGAYVSVNVYASVHMQEIGGQVMNSDFPLSNSTS